MRFLVFDFGGQAQAASADTGARGHGHAPLLLSHMLRFSCPPFCALARACVCCTLLAPASPQTGCV
eukprot:128975-Rhodomonas_salina.1